MTVSPFTKNGRPYFSVKYRDENGHRKNKSFSDKREAKDFDGSIVEVIRQKKAAILNGGNVEALMAMKVASGELNGDIVDRIVGRTAEVTTKIKTAVPLFVQACRIGRENHKPVRPHTADSYEHKLRPFVDLFGEKMAGEIGQKEAREYRDHLIATRRSRAQAKNSLVIVKMLFAWLITDRAELKVNPFEAVRVLTEESNITMVTEDDIYSDEQIGKLVAEAKRQATTTNRFPVQYHKDLAVLTLMVYAGLRIGEALAVEWDNVDLEAKTVDVRQTLLKDMTIGPPKTKQAVRVVALHPKAVELLKLCEARAAGKYVSSCVGGEDGEEEGRPTSYRNFKRTLDRLMKGAKIPLRKPHSLRHYFASKLIDSGYDGPSLRSQIGHADLAFTVKVYGHLLNRHTRVTKDVDRMANVEFA
ncbi:site-specific integrase [Mesorhizobium sp. M8A.F.Ca.ET.021.01.1.1]|uniref:tyrosine-type recombinase/integrase n=1 Tax=Mesorhizobium sp. M8A.F.Ca.ET.021.01.1.1 TaxID=2496757 RepID=UPI000FCBBAEB|nr:site-specific integrase [Mesorhizobium sp. M8A.F.Ca.ET.021.01.1.1]RUW57112.1 site-specific integrase [Mesorhizobium sp. M8A.F.Ca.ET.021.01.1.1]